MALWRALTGARHGGPGLGRRLIALPRMLVASLRRGRRRYDGLGRLLLMALAVVYLALPVDLIPELFLGVLGLVDDAVVVAWLAGAVISETGRFLEWEAIRKAQPLPGAAIPGRVVEQPVADR